MATATVPQRQSIPQPRLISLRGTYWLVAMLVLLCAATELASRLLIARTGRIEMRLAAEYRAALQPPIPGKPYLLFLGNSLLESAIDFPALTAQFAPAYDSRRFFVSQTCFDDWYFGLKRLFDTGARPRVVFLMLDDIQLFADNVLGSYFGRRMMRSSDILEVQRATHLSPTETAGILFSHYSEFYGLRADVRKILLARLIPDLPALTRVLVRQPPPAPLDDLALERIGGERLRRLERLCRDHGANFVFLPAPTQRVIPLRNTAQRSGVNWLMPFTAGEYPDSLYKDGFHLNSAGGAVYTRQLIDALRNRAAAYARQR